MKQTLTLTASSDPLDLDPWFSGTPLMVTGTVPTYPTMDRWMMQLWKRPHDGFATDAAALISAVGAEASGVMTVTFTAAQMSGLDLSYEAGANNFFLTIGGLDANNLPRAVRGGTIEIIPVPFVTADGSTITGISVQDDMASFVFNGATYTVPVVETETPEGAVEGELIVIDDMLVITIDGISYTTPVSET